MKVGSLCSGYGGLDMAIERMFSAETVWHCEIDGAASKVLEARWPGVPNHHDLTTVDWSTVEPVDIVCAGWPCQPWSLAGKRKGIEDERAIWPEVARAVRELRPRFVVLENVSAVVVLGELARAAGDLATLGYDAQWTCLSASEVGAPHKRERFFLVAADATSVGRDEGWPESARFFGGPDVAVGGGGDTPLDLFPTPKASDSSGGKHNSDGHADSLPVSVRLLPTPKSADRSDCACEHNRNDPDLRAITFYTQQWGQYEPAIRRWEAVTRPAPAPTEPNSKGNPRLSARFAEWMMGLPGGWVTGVDVSRSAHLKILGNGVVPQQAEAALSWLLSV